MAVERIDSLFNIPEINKEFESVRAGLSDSLKSLTDLFNTIKSFKGTTITTLTGNTADLNSAITGSIQTTAKAAQGYDQLTKKITDQVKSAYDLRRAVKDASESYDQLVRASIKNKISMDDLNTAAVELKISYKEGIITAENYAKSMEPILAAERAVKISNQDINKALNNLEKQTQASTGSNDELRASLNLLTQQYDKLSESERGTEGGQGLLKTIQTIDSALKQAEGTTGRFRMNVGNYEGAFSTLREELKRVNGQLGEMETRGKTAVQNLGGAPVGFNTGQWKGGTTSIAGPGGQTTNLLRSDAAAYKELSGQAQALNIILEQQDKGFKSVTMQTRAAERALQTLEAAGLGGSEGFEKLRESTIEAAQAQKEFMRQEKLLESEAPVLGAITLAAKGLAGAYAVGAGSVALFAEGNEKVEKELNKLVAIMTILQGLQEAYELINKSGAAAQAIRMWLMKATNAVIGEQAAVTQIDAAATEELAVAETEAATSAEVQTTAMTELAVATEGVAAAEEVAAVGALSLSRALVATGIGAAIAAIAVAIAYVISKIPDWIRGNDISIKQQGEIAEAVKRANDALIDQVKTLTDLDGSTKRYYENQLSLANAAGQNEYRQFAIKKQINAQERELAQDQINLLGATNEQQSKLKGTLDALNLKRREAIRIQQEILAVPEQNQTSDQKDQLTAATKNAELYGKQLESITGLYEAGKKAREDLFAANQKDGQEELAMAKFTAAEERKLTYETGRLQVEAAKDRNSKILSDARSTSAQRLAAIKSDRNQELKEAQLERNNLDPNATVRETEIADAKLRATRERAQSDYEQKSRQERRKAYERDRDTRLDVYKSGLQQQVSLEDEVLNKKIGTEEGDNSAVDQLNALRDRLMNQKQLVEADREEELDKEGLTNAEKNAIKKRANDALYSLDVKYLDDFRSLNKKILDATLAEWDRYYEDRKTQVQQDTNIQIDALNKRLAHGKISQSRYDDERKLIEDEKAEHEINLQVLKDRIRLASFKQGSKEYSDANAQLQQDLATQSDTHLKGQQDKKDIARKEIDKTFTDIKSQADSYSSAIVDVIDIGYNTQKVHLEELEVRQQRAYEQQVKNITDSTASEEQKSIRLKILDDQRQVQKEQHDRKQRQLDIQKAQYDKAKDILGIITGTALAVVKALPDLPLAVSVGILGGAELAAAIATPLPHYKEGIGMPGQGYHPGGGAVVGDGGEKELILEPGMPARWSANRATRESLLPYTKVIPSHKINEMIMSGMFVNQQGALMNFEPIDNRKELQELKEAVIWSGKETKAAIKSSRPRIVNKITVSASWQTYVHNAVFK